MTRTITGHLTRTQYIDWLTQLLHDLHLDRIKLSLQYANARTLLGRANRCGDRQTRRQAMRLLSRLRAQLRDNRRAIDDTLDALDDLS